MNIVITGGNGFLGSKLAEKFVSKNHDVIILDINKQPFDNTKKYLKKVKFIKADITSLSKLLKAKIKNNSLLLHCAGQPSAALSYKDPMGDLKKNIIGMVNIVEFAKIKNIKKIIFASTFNVYRENYKIPKLQEENECSPKSLYAISKLAAENYLKLYGNHLNIKWNILRMFNIYGPGQDPRNLNLGMINIFLNMARDKSNITVKGSLKRFRDFIYIDDVIEAWYQIALDKKNYNKIYNLGSGKRVNLKELLKAISKVLKKNIKINVKKGTPGDFMGCYADIKKIKKDLKFTPKMNLENGLETFNNWLNNLKKI